MPMYLTRFSYTPETWAMMIAQPEDRRRAATAYIESVGGRLHGFWYSFGTHDGPPNDALDGALAAALSAFLETQRGGGSGRIADPAARTASGNPQYMKCIST